MELLPGQNENPVGLSRNESNSISLAKLLQGVEKSYDPGVKLLDASERSSSDNMPLMSLSREREAEEGEKRFMRSRTDRKMERISEHYNGKELDDNQRKVVDVFSGNADNQTIEVERSEGTAKVVIRQGTENKAGTKHSIFRHFETRSNYISAEDIAMIPEVIAKGERIVDVVNQNQATTLILG